MLCEVRSPVIKQQAFRELRAIHRRTRCAQIATRDVLGITRDKHRDVKQLLQSRTISSQPFTPQLACCSSAKADSYTVDVPVDTAVLEFKPHPLRKVKKDDVLDIQVDRGATQFATVLSDFDSVSNSVEIGLKGKRVKLHLDNQQKCWGCEIGLYPDPSDPLVQSIPGWAPALQAYHMSAAKTTALTPEPTPPSPLPPSSSSPPSSPTTTNTTPSASSVESGTYDAPLTPPSTPTSSPSSSASSDTADVSGSGAAGSAFLVSRLSVVHSLSLLTLQVAQDPGRWCDGAGPRDPPPRPLQSALGNAGELLALLGGWRGAAMVQVHIGWDKQADQLVWRPLVVELLRTAMSHPDIVCFTSKAPGGMGLSALLSSRQEPWSSWTRHLASFGCQAALVADSPYYKLLIGRVMGYKHENILFHIRNVHGLRQPTAEVEAAVEKELSQLSNQPPVLPWTKPAPASTDSSLLASAVQGSRGSRGKGRKGDKDSSGKSDGKGSRKRQK